MIYRDKDTGTPLSWGDVKQQAYPTNLPVAPDAAVLDWLGVEPIQEAPAPKRKSWQRVVELDPADTDGDGIREQQWAVEDRDLSDVQAESKREIDRAAEQRRSQLITEGFGQVMSYLRKGDQARRFKAGDTSDVSIIEALVGVEVKPDGTVVETADEVADVILANANEWEKIEAKIDAKRRGAKIAADQATTPEDAYKARNVDWPEV